MRLALASIPSFTLTSVTHAFPIQEVQGKALFFLCECSEDSFQVYVSI